MKRTLLVLALVVAGPFASRSHAQGLGFTLAVTPSYVHFDREGTDNWSGSRPSIGGLITGSLDWTFKKDKSTIGLGGGIFFWTDQPLFPVYLSLQMDMVDWAKDPTKKSPLVHRLSVEGRIGAVLGNTSTAAGRLRPSMFVEGSMLYRLKQYDRSSLHLGLDLGLIQWKGPYEQCVEGVCEGSRPVILTVGPTLHWRFH